MKSNLYLNYFLSFKMFNGRPYYQSESDFFFKNKKEENDYWREVSSSESDSDE